MGSGPDVPDAGAVKSTAVDRWWVSAGPVGRFENNRRPQWLWIVDFCSSTVKPAIEFCQNWNTDHSESVAIWVSGFTAIWPRCSPIDARKWRTAL